MDIKAFTAGVIAFLTIIPVFGKDIYRCEVNSAIKYQEEKCDEHSVPLHLKELAAPLEGFDAKAIDGQKARTQEHSIKERVARHQKRIHQYRKKMDAELHKLEYPNEKSQSKKSYPRNSVKNQEQTTALNNIAAKNDRSALSDQKGVVINHYKALIETEEFQIKLLIQELQMYKKLNSQ